MKSFSKLSMLAAAVAFSLFSFPSSFSPPPSPFFLLFLSQKAARKTSEKGAGPDPSPVKEAGGQKFMARKKAGQVPVLSPLLFPFPFFFSLPPFSPKRPVVRRSSVKRGGKQGSGSRILFPPFLPFFFFLFLFRDRSSFLFETPARISYSYKSSTSLFSLFFLPVSRASRFHDPKLRASVEQGLGRHLS